MKGVAVYVAESGCTSAAGVVCRGGVQGAGNPLEQIEACKYL